MPFVTVTVAEKTLTAAQKAALLEKITAACIEVEGERVRPLTLVMIQETLRLDGVALGGRVLAGAPAGGGG